MASTSSNALIGTAEKNHMMYDVFISFRGKDTRYRFTDHLYEALKRAGLRAFRDTDEINSGHELKPELEKAIKESRAFIVVLSENYANSTWCLDELSLIIEQRRNFSRYVLPVFYHVDPSDIRNLRGHFSIKADSVVRPKWTEVNVNRWKQSLTEVANLIGLVVSGPETSVIKEIVDAVVLKLDLKLVSTPYHLTGIEARAEFINSWLKIEQFNDAVLAICGMGGSGKTTLAQHIYNTNKHKYESSSFLEEIGTRYQKDYNSGLRKLQKQLLRDIKGGNKTTIPNVCEGTRKIEEALRKSKVLIVLDEIDDEIQLDALLGGDALSTESKIVITTRNLDIYAWFGSRSRGCRIYKLKMMNDQESVELLSSHAFGSKVPMEGFEDLSVQLANYCEGNPLALRVLGSSLFVSAEDPRERNCIIESWKSTINTLISLKGDLDSKIQRILRRSFDSLPHDGDKELFLKIVFFFVGEYEDYVIKILERDWKAAAGTLTLINKGLLMVSPSKKLMVHQLLQEMGRKIVRGESKYVWDDDKSINVIKNEQGSATIEGLALDISKLNQVNKSLSTFLTTNGLAKLDKLKLLKLKDLQLKGNYINFPKLTWLCWHGFHLKTIPPGLLTSSLVALDMSFGQLETFEPPVVITSLKILNFRGSHKLISIRILHRLPSLETLILWDCSSLNYLCPSIVDLENLTQLDLTGCKINLWKLPWATRCFKPERKHSIPQSLEKLFLNDFHFLGKNDDSAVMRCTSLSYINLGNSLFKILPSFIDLSMLRTLDLTCCPKLKSLLCLPSALEKLYTYQCKSLEKVTFQSSKFRLKEFIYEGCVKLSDIQGLFKLVPVKKLDEANLAPDVKWIKTYQDYTLNLVGDEITKGRTWNIQMLYEYGIQSTYLPKLPNMEILSHISPPRIIRWTIPSCSTLTYNTEVVVFAVYRWSGEEKGMWALFAKISNITKGLTWIYNPVVFAKPTAGQDVVWITRLPIGKMLDIGDQIEISIIGGNGLQVSACDARLMSGNPAYIRILNKENQENSTKEVIGGDLSEFELTKGVYYLCRRDFFMPTIPEWLNQLFGNEFDYTKLKGWKNIRSSGDDEIFKDRSTYRGIRHGVADVIPVSYKRWW